MRLPVRVLLNLVRAEDAYHAKIRAEVKRQTGPNAKSIFTVIAYPAMPGGFGA